MNADAAHLKACCAAAYGAPAARWLLGDRFHPGGAAATSRLVAALDLRPGDVAVDVASGPGTSAIQLARETGAAAVGVDLSPENVAAAERAAAAARLEGRVRFLVGDAEALPFATASFDGALCECSLCTFPDKRAAARELARVLRTGARLALSDVVAERDQLPSALRTLGAHVACLGAALSAGELVTLLRHAGFDVETLARHDHDLDALLARVEDRLRPLGIGLDLVAAARAAVRDGALGYVSVVARRGATRVDRRAARAANPARTSM